MLQIWTEKKTIIIAYVVCLRWRYEL